MMKLGYKNISTRLVLKKCVKASVLQPSGRFALLDLLDGTVEIRPVPKNSKSGLQTLEIVLNNRLNKLKIF